MKSIFLALAIIITSSITLTSSANAQNNLGINPEHMIADTMFKAAHDSLSRGDQKPVNIFDQEISLEDLSPTLVKKWLDLYSRLNYTAAEQAATAKGTDYELSNAGAAAFILMHLFEKQPVWYLTRMSVVLK
jgi:hypothetical protein